MEANKILKGMMSNVNKYNRRSLARTLSVDIQTCEPILNPVYDRSMKENLFIFLNENNRILGFLKGCEPLKELNNNYVGYSEYPKNRKNLSANATNVLMFTPSMRKFRIKSTQGNNKLYKYNQHKAELKERLRAYKENKYKEVSHEDILKMSQDIITKLNNNLFNNNLLEKLEPVISGFDNSMFKALSTFAGDIDAYVRYYNEYERELKFYEKMNKEVIDIYSYREMSKCKNTILLWNNILKEA